MHAGAKTVVWSTTGGSISGDAVFTAPPSLGTVTVTASAQDNAAAKDDCIIHVIAEPTTASGNGAGAQLSAHTALGLPAEVDNSGEHFLVQNDAYVPSYNSTLKNPNWVSWMLDGTDIGGATRNNVWHTERSITGAQAADKDYNNAGYDRGHMCPSGDRTRREDINLVTFNLSNALPQVHGLNAGPWQRFEEYLQRLTSQGNEIFIVAGGAYGKTSKTIGNGVTVPDATWKVAVVLPRIGDRAPAVTSATRVIAARRVHAERHRRCCPH